MIEWVYDRADHRPYIRAVVDALSELGIAAEARHVEEQKGMRFAIARVVPPSELADRWCLYELALRWDEREGWSLHGALLAGDGERLRWSLIDSIVGDPDEVAVAVDLRLQGVGDADLPGQPTEFRDTASVESDLRSYSAK